MKGLGMNSKRVGFLAGAGNNPVCILTRALWLWGEEFAGSKGNRAGSEAHCSGPETGSEGNSSLG